MKQRRVIPGTRSEPEAQPLVIDVSEQLCTDYFLVDELLQPKERALRNRVRRFCEKDVLPIINDYWEQAEFPFELVPKLAAPGIAGGPVRGSGCPGHSPLAMGLGGMELAR